MAVWLCGAGLGWAGLGWAPFSCAVSQSCHFGGSVPAFWHPGVHFVILGDHGSMRKDMWGSSRVGFFLTLRHYSDPVLKAFRAPRAEIDDWRFWNQMFFDFGTLLGSHFEIFRHQGLKLIILFVAVFNSLFAAIFQCTWTLGAPQPSVWYRTCCKDQLSTKVGILMIRGSSLCFLETLGAVCLACAALGTGFDL